MPTGYTYEVAQGKVTELEPFVMCIARGMGALVTMRDDDPNAPIPERFEPSNRNAEKLTELRAEIGRLSAMTDAEAQAASDAEYEADQREQSKYFADKAIQRTRYEAMIAKLKAWDNAPEGIKEFGLSQLQQSLEFDCGGDGRWYRDPVERDGVKWRDAKIAAVAKDITYHSDEEAKERQRVNERNAWLAQLRKSLAKAQGQ